MSKRLQHFPQIQQDARATTDLSPIQSAPLAPAILPFLERAYDLLPQGESHPQDFPQPISRRDCGKEPPLQLNPQDPVKDPHPSPRPDSIARSQRSPPSLLLLPPKRRASFPFSNHHPGNY